MAAFYALRACPFYCVAGPGCRDRFITFRLVLPVHSEVEKIVHWMPEVLLAAEIAFGRLNRCVPEQELNLLKFTTPVVAQLRTSPAQVVWCNMVQTCSLTAMPDHIPHNVLRDAMAPHLSLPCHGSEDLALCDVGSARPLVESGFNPVWNGHGANVATLAYQIDHRPMPLPHLDFV